MNTPTPLRRLAIPLTGLLLAAAPLAVAQTTPPAWSAAHALALPADEDSDQQSTFDGAGNRYAAGSFAGTLTLGATTLTSRGKYDAYLAKYAPNGTLLWARQLGSPAEEVVGSVAVDAAGAVYVTGSFSGPVELEGGLRLEHPASALPTSAFFVRYSPLGIPTWATQSTSNGAAGADIGVDAQGRVFATGLSFAATLTVGGSSVATAGLGQGTSAFLVRLNAATGAVQTLSVPFTFLPDAQGGGFLTDPQLAVGPTGVAYVLSDFLGSVRLGDQSTRTSAGSADLLIIQTGAAGEVVWGKQYGTAADEGLGRGRVDAAGNLYLTGGSTGPIGEGATTLPNAGSYDALLLKYAPDGTLAWARAVGGRGLDGFSDVLLDAAGNPYVTGLFEGRVAFGSRTIQSAGGADVLVAAYTAQGVPRWIQQAGGSGDEVGERLGLDAAGNLYVAGVFDEAITFGPFALATTPANEITSFVARLGGAVLSTAAARPLALALAPNPARTTVRLPGLPAGRLVEVLDALGRLVRTAALAPDASFSVQGLAPGLYLVRATDAQNQAYAGRLVVE